MLVFRCHIQNIVWKLTDWNITPHWNCTSEKKFLFKCSCVVCCFNLVDVDMHNYDSVKAHCYVEYYVNSMLNILYVEYIMRIL